MIHKNLLAEMKQSIGTKDPIVFFDKMVDLFDMLFNRIEELQLDLNKIKQQSALSISWEPKIASDLLAEKICKLRPHKDLYFNEISLLKKAFAEDLITQNYTSFCKFWEETLGYHPFLDYK